MEIALNEENIKQAAILTFFNVIFLSMICTIVDTLRRRYTVDRPVKTIISAAEQIAKGDYSVRIPPLPELSSAEGLARIADCFNKMAKELSGVESLQSDFIANVSHEMKTPLAIMQNYGTLLSTPELPEADRLRYAKAVCDGSRRLGTLVSGILHLNKLEHQELCPRAERYALGEQLCEVMLRFEPIWEEKEIEIDTALDEGVMVNADPELLSLVWSNLLSNAFKFTDRGGRVSVSLRREEGFFVVTVSDTGCGISPEIGAHIFEKFYQGDSSHATEGNGLGLALVRRVIDILHGEIMVESRAGEGATFTVKLRDS